MADKLDVTIAQIEDYYEVSAVMSELEKLPAAVFLYQNDGTATLGEYIGVCNVEDIAKRKVWEGVAIPSFGNRYVRHDAVLKVVSDSTAAASVAANIVAGVRRLKSTLPEPSSTTTTYEV